MKSIKDSSIKESSESENSGLGSLHFENKDLSSSLISFSELVSNELALGLMTGLNNVWSDMPWILGILAKVEICGIAVCANLRVDVGLVLAKEAFGL